MPNNAILWPDQEDGGHAAAVDTENRAIGLRLIRLGRAAVSLLLLVVDQRRRSDTRRTIEFIALRICTFCIPGSVECYYTYIGTQHSTEDTRTTAPMEAMENNCTEPSSHQSKAIIALPLVGEQQQQRNLTRTQQQQQQKTRIDH